MKTEQLLDLYRQHPCVSTDTRKIQLGDLFFALRGDRFDGNAFAQKALEMGAAYVVIDNPEFDNPNDDRLILVEDSLKALQDLANAYRKTFSIPFLGITGSNGKTTTKELMASVLGTERKVFATKGNFNNHIGVPLTLLSMPVDTEIAIVEMGANKMGDIQELVAIAEPTQGLITNIGAAHLEGFGSLDGVQKGKGELFDFLRAHPGTIFVNETDERVKAIADGIDSVVTYGDSDSDFSHQLISESLGGMELTISLPGGQMLLVESQLTGAYNCLNILAAAAVGHHFGISNQGIAKGIAAYLPKNNRSQLIQRQNYSIWLDAYNANPSSMQAAIRHIFHDEGKKVVLILGDMLEMGIESPRVHAELGEFINEFNPLMTIGVGPEMKHSLAVLNGPNQWFADVEAAGKKIISLTKGADLILIKGSRGIALERLVDML